ncbi:hypothetical protein Cyast_1581 [Cyanobacterium stanieri PCC 7202]|uniref:Uncharacterized protein n=1 Tax=Cyanobacterium stanieri (strain ATCC 29140 / PCC 7202) TaxID=292563 RepID=K9YM32_CYASC|nr:hypothetical protein Cyast_1581 [Cyanobacterium stanieri PCC 7202]
MNIQNQFNKNNSSTQAPKQIEEITLTIGIKNLSPNMVSAEFLQMSGITPGDWEVAQQPIVTPNGSQITYKSGVKIIVQPGVINFVEGLGTKSISDLSFAKVAIRYIEKFSNAEYQGLSIAPKIIAPLSGDETAGKRFINEQLLKTGGWSHFQGMEPQAAVNLFYQLQGYTLAVNINPARLQQANNMVIPAVLFAGNFTYRFDGLQGGVSTLQGLMDRINGWEDNLNTFRVLVNEQFLHQAISYPQSLFN